MAGDFSQLMAEMIARARPPQAPSPGRPVVGGGGPLMSTEKAATAQVSVDAGAIMRLFGYKTPEEKKKIGQDFVDMRRTMKDEDWEAVKGLPDTQKYLEGASRSGVPNIYQSGKTPLGKPVYDIIKPTEEERGVAVAGQPTKETVLAGFYGPKRREEAIGAEKELAPFDVEKFIATSPPDQVKNYFTKKAEEKRLLAEAAETPMVKGLNNSLVSMHEASARQAEASAALEWERKRLLPQEQERANRLANAQILHYGSEVEKNKAMGDWYKRDKAVDTERKEAQKAVNDVWRQSLTIWNKSTSMISQPVEMDKQLDELHGMVSAHIFGSQAALGNSKAGNESFAYWLSRVSDQTSKEVRKVGVGPLGIGKVVGIKRPDPESEVRLRKYAQRTWQLLTTMGTDVNPDLAELALQNIASVYSMTTPTPSMNTLAQAVQEYCRVIGVKMTGFDDLVKSRLEELKREEELEYPELQGVP